MMGTRIEAILLLRKWLVEHVEKRAEIEKALAALKSRNRAAGEKEFAKLRKELDETYYG